MDNVDEEGSMYLLVGTDPIDVDTDKRLMKISKMHMVREKESSYHRYGLLTSSSLWMKRKKKKERV